MTSVVTHRLRRLYVEPARKCLSLSSSLPNIPCRPWSSFERPRGKAGQNVSSEHREEQLELSSFVDVLRKSLDRRHVDWGARPLRKTESRLLHARIRPHISQHATLEHLKRMAKLQLEACRTPEEVLRAVSAALKQKPAATLLPQLQSDVQMALNRGVAGEDTPDRVPTFRTLLALSSLYNMYRAANLELPDALILDALFLAAESYDASALLFWLQIHQSRGLSTVLSDVRVSLLRALLRGHSRLLKSGRSLKEQKMCSVLLSPLGSDFNPPRTGRADGEEIHVQLWIQNLATCKQSDKVWENWENWHQAHGHATKKDITSEESIRKSRQAAFFISQLLVAGSRARAWKALKESGISAEYLDRRARADLVSHPEDAIHWDEHLQTALEEKWTTELEALETALSLQWVPSENKGYYILRDGGKRFADLTIWDDHHSKNVAYFRDYQKHLRDRVNE